MSDRPWLTRAEVARKTGFTVATVSRWAREGRLTKYKASSTRQGRVRFDPDEVDALIAELRTNGGAA